MISDDDYIAGDSYILEVQVFEDEAQTIPQDLTTITNVVYGIWYSNDLVNPIFETELADGFITIPDRTNGKILVDLRSDQANIRQGQLFQTVKIVDDSGRITTVLSEYLNIRTLPKVKGIV
ncbi:putative distal tail protein [Vibrio phage ICP1]|nr:hypothetical protein ICP12017FMathbaria_095 [Vibrio phage ICP1_2017_F_Mathbaria]QVW04139.1 putative distal tail protein [Vibrio phage ICP1]QVW04366.1 putative distal tail protein [Vibrio phage ICP1]QVW05033.1 putative distal tail protein [Vibrio phage ICP1]QVW05259.1 putative distal tail protein [Vibrio phage ICP1]